jgi:hypothetical protein
MAVTASKDVVEHLSEALAHRGIAMEYHRTGAEALARLQALLPLGGTKVMTGSSTTLAQIGFTAWLTERHRAGEVYYYRAVVHTQGEREAREENRRLATLSEYFLGSVNALTVEGEAIVADHAGTRLGGYIYAARNVIWVVGINKLVADVEEGIRRVREVALPQEDARIRAEGGEGSEIGKLTIFFHESRANRIRLLMVGEELGF